MPQRKLKTASARSDLEVSIQHSFIKGALALLEGVGLWEEGREGGRLGAMARSRDFSSVCAMTGVGAARRDEEGPSSSGLASGRRSEGHVPPRRRAACVSGSSLCAFLGTCLLFASMASGSSGGGTAALRQKSCWGGKTAAMPSTAGGCMSGFELQGKRAGAASAEVNPIPISRSTTIVCPNSRCLAGSDWPCGTMHCRREEAPWNARGESCG